MKAYWLNGALCVEPQTPQEREALGLVTETLQFVQVDQGVQAGPIAAESRDKQTVVGVDELLEVVAERGSGHRFASLDGPLG